ncbi:MAG: hypothetical protein HQ509_00515 [Candidatus Marinimicrobia bacterium]|nr:hypothetical protein [Candidatus Neomarinimicrobiota bacterium]
MLPDSKQIVQMVDELATALSLTEEQKTKVSEMHFAHFEEAKDQMEKSKTSRNNDRHAMDALRKEFEEQVKAVLNDEQKKQFETFIKNHGPEHGPKRDDKRN